MANTGPLTSCVGALLDYTQHALAHVEGESKVKTTLKAATITAVEGLYYLASLVERAVRFVIAKIKAVISSPQVQDFKENKLPVIVEKAVAAKDYVVGKAQSIGQAIYSKLNRFPTAPTAK